LKFGTQQEINASQVCAVTFVRLTCCVHAITKKPRTFLICSLVKLRLLTQNYYNKYKRTHI